MLDPTNYYTADFIINARNVHKRVQMPKFNSS